MDRFGKQKLGLMKKLKLQVFKISANLVHRDLRNATFEGKSH